MVSHFFSDITHFDGKFFTTVKDLLFRPGFLSAEYMAGKRSSYLHPVRMYVFTSAIFFLLFFSVFKQGNIKFNLNQPLSPAARAEMITETEKELLADTADAGRKKLLVMLKDTSQKITNADVVRLKSEDGLQQVRGRQYKSVHEYDSVQKSLPPGEKDGWFPSLMERKVLQWTEKYGDDPDAFSHYLSSSLLHRLPYLLFVSLPLFAFILKLLYLRRKNFFYADHAVFSIHHFVFTFILLLFVFTLNSLQTATGWGFLVAVEIILFFSGGVYLFLAMKRFYSQGFGKTAVKFILLNFAALVMMTVLFAVFLLLSVFEI